MTDPSTEPPPITAADFAADVPLDAVIAAPNGPSLEDAMRGLAVPAVSVSTIVGGEVDWHAGWGVTSTDETQRVGTATMFQAGSISKLVSAVLTLRLVDAGLFSLDDCVEEVAGRNLLFTADGAWRPRVTVRQLLSHTGGVNNGGFSGYLTDDHPSVQEIIAGSDRTNSPPIRVIALPGTGYSYSGGGYLILQDMITRRLGRSFEDLADAYVFEPLGMSRSTFRQSPPDADHAQGHRDNGRALDGGHRRYPELAAAGLWTTAGDLATLVVALTDAYRGATDALLSLGAVREMFRQQHSSASYGLGVVLDPRAEGLWFGHGGDTQGFLNEVLGSTGGQGVVVMTNTDVSKPLITAIKARVASIYGWRDSPHPAPEQQRSGGALFVPSGSFLTEDGQWIHLQPGDDHTLELRLAGQPEAVTLLHSGDRRWRARGLNVVLTSNQPDRVTITQLMQHGPLEPLTARREPEGSTTL